MHQFEPLLTRAEAVFGGRRIVSFCGRIPGDTVSYEICHEEDYITFLTRYALRLAHDDTGTHILTLPCLDARLAPEEREPSADTDEITEVQPSADDAQLQDPLLTRIDEDDQGSNDHPSPPDDPDNNREVIYISDDPLDDQDGGADGQISSADHSQDVADTTEDVDPGQGVLGHLRSLNSLPIENVPEFARMFCLDPRSITPKTEKRLPGTRLPLRLPQLAYLFRVVTSARDHPDLRGHYNGDTMASGKTISTMAIVVLTQTLQQIDDHIDNNPYLHCLPDTDEVHSRCPLGDAFGVQCLCEPENPTRDFIRSTARGVDVQVCPKGLEQNWIEQWKAYVQPTFDEPNHPLRGRAVIHGYTIGDGYHLAPIDPGSPPLLTKELLLKVELESDSKHSIKLDVASVPETFDGLLGVAKLTDQKRAAAYNHSSTSKKKGQAVWLLLTREKLSLDWANDAHKHSPWSSNFRVHVKPKNGKSGWIIVVARAMLALRSIAFDEFNLCQGIKSNLHTATVSVCRRLQPGGQATPRVYFLSGTPANKSVTDFDASYSIIQPDREQRRLFESATRRLDRCRTRHSGEDHQAETRAAMLAVKDLISPWLTARGEGSPILDGKIGTSRSPPQRVVVSFVTPERCKEAYEQLVRSAQEEIANEPSFDIQKYQGTLKSLNIMLRGASVPGDIPWKSDDVGSDLQLDGGRYESHVDEYTKDDGLFKSLSKIINNASRGIVQHDRQLQYTSTRGPLHVLLFTAFPAVAAAAFHYVKKECDAFAEAELVTAWQQPGEREDVISRLVQRAGEIRVSGQQKSIIVVTTFKVLSAGRNDLVFANIVIKLGEPWTNALTEQAIGRVDRPGQGQPTFFFDLFREDNEAEALVRVRNRHRKEILGEKLSDNRLFGVIDANPSP
ncbi:hypothetical protein LCI18_015163 [Fusarium solani-melongenae]|uniref:Uncharacterized protein n=1 Tax=Fusarium solani subsp. cucurbitae TaxID=2747967 RepID=A0ACD3ZSB4_FUSSC|nr:hypothetical protein LCI18_015163 [Fusarium solani-melongenae]